LLAEAGTFPANMHSGYSSWILKTSLDSSIATKVEAHLCMLPLPKETPGKTASALLWTRLDVAVWKRLVVQFQRLFVPTHFWL